MTIYLMNWKVMKAFLWIFGIFGILICIFWKVYRNFTSRTGEGFAVNVSIEKTSFI